MKTYTKEQLIELSNVYRKLDEKEPDAGLVDDLLKCLMNFKSWNYYGQGEIMVANSQVEIVTECLFPEGEEKYFGVWKEYPHNYFYWKGDVTESRLRFLVDLSAKAGIVEINVPYEGGKPAFKMVRGSFSPVKGVE